jgi:hypothetical protein
MVFYFSAIPIPAGFAFPNPAQRVFSEIPKRAGFARKGTPAFF